MSGTTIRQSGRSHRTASSGSGSKMSVYRDPSPSSSGMLPPPAPIIKKHKASSASKSSITIFRDEEPGDDSPESNEVQVPSTPKFTPYRDEDVSPAILLARWQVLSYVLF